MINPSKEKRRTLQSATQWLHGKMMAHFLKVAGKASMSRCINILVEQKSHSLAFFLSHTLKMIWVNLVAMLECLALRTVK